MSIISWINFFGLWIPFVTSAIYGYWLHYQNPDIILSWESLLPGIQIGFLLALLNIMVNLATFANGKRKYHALDALDYMHDPYIRASRKEHAKYPSMPEVMRKKEPVGIVIGKRGSYYACNDLNAPGAHHTMILGESGCGKTSTVVLDSILCNDNISMFAIDVKGELSEKGLNLQDPKNKIINPQDHQSYGYDPLYSIAEDADEQTIVDTMKDISYSLIPINPSEKNPFWADSARDLLFALMVYFFRQGKRNLIDIMDEIVSRPIEETIEEIYNEAVTDSPEHKTIVRFYGMATETLSGINAQMMVTTSLFINDYNIRYMLRDNPKKVTPRNLNNGDNIFLVITEDKLSSYAHILHLIVNQTISEMELRPENSQPVMMIIDELPRILSSGKIQKLENALETLRSRNVTLMLIAQSLEALQRAYSKSDVDAMLNNCPYKIILSATSADTQNAVVRWAGKYREYKYSTGMSGSHKNTNTSMEDKNIVEASELITLPQENEAIVISPYGYNRFSKVPYYQDKQISKKAASIKKSNALYHKAQV